MRSSFLFLPSSDGVFNLYSMLSVFTVYFCYLVCHSWFLHNVLSLLILKPYTWLNHRVMSWENLSKCFLYWRMDRMDTKCIHTYVHTHTSRVCAQTHMYLCECTWLHAYVCTYIYIHTYVSIYASNILRFWSCSQFGSLSISPSFPIPPLIVIHIKFCCVHNIPLTGWHIPVSPLWSFVVFCCHTMKPSKGLTDKKIICGWCNWM